MDEARAMAGDCLRCYWRGSRAGDELPLPEGEAPREAVREGITVDLGAA